MDDFRRTKTTRHLCAAAHIDWKFRRKVIKQLVEDEFEALGPSFGVDLVAVLKHCVAARRRKLIRDIFLVLIFVYLVIEYLVLPPINLFSLFTFLTIAWLIIFVEEWISHYRIVGRNLSEGSYNPDAVKENNNGKLKILFEKIPEWYNPNVIVYSGFSPFVGSGFWIGGWTLASDLDKGRKEKGKKLEPQRFTLTEFYDYVVDSLKKLNIEKLNIEDKLYVEGTTIRNDKRFISNPFKRPYTHVPQSLINEFKEFPTEPIRYYLSIRAIDWEGELVLSIFLRFFKVGEKLFAETSYYLLPPLDSYYHQFDRIKPVPSWIDRILFLHRSIGITPFILAFAPFTLLAKIINRIAVLIKRWDTKYVIKNNPVFDYGAARSLRENESSDKYRKYFQRLDKEMYLKLIERQLLNSIIDFLDSKNIDTSDLKEREQVILNEGVIVSGGNVMAENITVGKNAKSKITRVRKVRKGRTSETTTTKTSSKPVSPLVLI